MSEEEDCVSIGCRAQKAFRAAIANPSFWVGGVFGFGAGVILAWLLAWLL